MSHEHEYRALCQVVVEALHLVGRHGDRLSQIQQEILVDTKKLLDAVAKERSESASLLALNAGQTKALQDISAQNQDMVSQIAALKATIEGMGGTSDPEKDKQIAALKQQVADLQTAADQAQIEIDQAATDLSADDEDVQKALEANVPPSAGNQQSGGGSAGSSSSSSSSTGSAGGDVQKPDPLPGTGVAQPATPPSDPNVQQSGSVDPAATAPNAPPEDASAAGQVPLQSDPQKLGSDPGASKAPVSGA